MDNVLTNYEDPVISNYLETWDKNGLFEGDFTKTAFPVTPVYDRAYKYYVAEDTALSYSGIDDMQINSRQEPGDLKGGLNLKMGVVKDYALEVSWDLKSGLFAIPPFGDLEISRVKGAIEFLNRGRNKRILDAILQIPSARKEAVTETFSTPTYNAYNSIIQKIDQKFPEVRPNGIILGEDVYKSLKKNTTIFPTGTFMDKVVTKEEIAAAFDLKYIEVVSGALRNVFKGKMFLYYANESIDIPSFLKVFSLNSINQIEDAISSSYFSALRWTSPRTGMKGSEFLKLGLSYDVQITCEHCGFLTEGIK